MSASIHLNFFVGLAYFKASFKLWKFTYGGIGKK